MIKDGGCVKPLIRLGVLVKIMVGWGETVKKGTITMGRLCYTIL
jgi:hypothetical protein